MFVCLFNIKLTKKLAELLCHALQLVKLRLIHLTGLQEFLHFLLRVSRERVFKLCKLLNHLHWVIKHCHPSFLSISILMRFSSSSFVTYSLKSGIGAAVCCCAGFCTGGAESKVYVSVCIIGTPLRLTDFK